MSTSGAFAIAERKLKVSDFVSFNSDISHLFDLLAVEPEPADVDVLDGLLLQALYGSHSTLL